jgi:hypothetical protein
MRLLVLALLLSSMTPSFCQSASQQPVDQDRLFQTPKQFQLENSRDLLKPPSFNFKAPLQLMSLPRVVRPNLGPKVGDPNLDAEIIHRPGHFALEEPHTPMSGRLYPNLKSLPIETARRDATPIE